MSVQPHVEVWDSCRLTNLLRLIHELPSSGFPFGIHIEKILKRDGGKCTYIDDVVGVKDAGGIELDPLHTTNGSASKNGQSCNGGLKPFGVAHGIGRHKVKVVGDHHSAKTPCKGPGDGRHVWVKWCSPAGLNLFEKPCSRLRTTWRQILDHRQHEPNHKSANLRVRLWITSSGSRR
jgi:hypothetical protein